MRKSNICKYICFEGINGSGKTTQALKLTDYLTEKGFNTIYTTEYNPIFLENLSNYKNKDKVVKQLIIGANSRAHYLDIIKPGLKQYDYIISDRGPFYNFCYGEVDIPDINFIFEYIYRKTYVPDLNILCDVKNIEDAINRIKNKSSSKSIKYHEKAKDLFLRAADVYPNFRIVDTSIYNIDQAHNVVKKIIDNF